MLHAIVEQSLPRGTPWPPDGHQALAAIVAYLQQAGTYVDGQAPYIGCSYGCSELSQAAIRACCVHGGCAALQTMPMAILVEHGNICGVKMGDGHAIGCTAVVAAQEYIDVATLRTSHSEASQEADIRQQGADAAAPQPSQAQSEGPRQQADQHGVSRCIVLLDRPLLPESKNAQFVVPPGSCGNSSTVVAWHCDASLQSCPAGHVMLYMACASTETPAQEQLQPVLDALLAAGDKDHAVLGEPAAAAHDVHHYCARPRSSNVASSASEDGRASAPGMQDAGPDAGHAVVSCFYTSKRCREVGPEMVPHGLHLCQAPGTECTMDMMAVRAEQIFAALYPGHEYMGSTAHDMNEGTAGWSQDTEAAKDELGAALQALGLA